VNIGGGGTVIDRVADVEARFRYGVFRRRKHRFV
jgi:hypothetical protein